MFTALTQAVSRLYLYDVFQALAFLGGVLLGVYNATRSGISPMRALDGAMWVVISALAGARGLYVFLYPGQFPTVVSWFDPRFGGQVFFGGFLATLLATLIYTRRYRMSLRTVGDVIAPALGLGHFLGRIGCFTGGCCYGRMTTLPWGVVFDQRGEGFPRHPTQLYEAGFLFLLFAWSFWKLQQQAPATGRPPLPSNGSDPHDGEIEGGGQCQRPAPVPGRIWGIYVLAYSGFRFLIEFLRDDDRGGFFTPLQLSPSQLIALGAGAGALLWLRLCSQLVLPGSRSKGPP